MKRYLYQNKKTNQRIASDKPLKDSDLVLVSYIRDGSMKSFEVFTK